MAEGLAAELPREATGALERLSRALFQDRVRYFPVRHHSPACAWHLQALIRDERPGAVLVEGPSDFAQLMPLLLDPGCRPPVAVYTAFVDEQRRTGAPGIPDPDGAPPRYLAFYPFCEHSPELVALRAGAEVGARLRFIDLPYAEQVLASQGAEVLSTTARATSLLAEGHLRHSRYLARLAQRAGCRDQDELWDHLFEVRYRDLETGRFARELAAYCLMGRLEYQDDALEVDGTAARERAMAAAIAEELATCAEGEWILVVTGGFHTVALPALVAAGPKPPRPASFRDTERQSYLMRYSFDQLDALNGYASGMPSPGYYDHLWCKQARPLAEALYESATELLVSLGRETRESDLAAAVSTADALAAVDQAMLLARLRGHPGPAREDLLDAVRSCFVKGPMDVDGAAIMARVLYLLSGDRVGEVPADAGRPPIIEDFRRQARALRLEVDDATPHDIRLDIYRSRRARATSRFLHALTFLGISYGEVLAGPNWVSGTGVDRIQEVWRTRWSPLVELQLFECSVWGASVEGAAYARLRARVAELDQEGRDRSTEEAVRLVVEALGMGLHRSLPDLVALVKRHIAEDGAFASVVAGVRQLLLLRRSWEPLEAQRLEEVPALTLTAYQRACFLVYGLGSAPDERIDAILDSLQVLRELLADDDAAFDAELFLAGLQTLRASPKAHPVIQGAAMGILFGFGRASEAELGQQLAGTLLGGAGDPAGQFGFLRGLLACARELAWSGEVVVETVDRALETWTEKEFLRAVPHLRLAMSGLTPRETNRVAERVAAYHGVGGLDLAVSPTVSAGDLARGFEVDRRVLEALEADGLGAWAEEGRRVVEE